MRPPRGRVQSPGRGLSGVGKAQKEVWPLRCEGAAGEALT